MFLSDATVTGMQHYYLTRILLSSHDPSIPKLGPRRVAALRAMDNDIKEHVRILCGLARSNSKLHGLKWRTCCVLTEHRQEPTQLCYRFDGSSHGW